MISQTVLQRTEEPLRSCRAMMIGRSVARACLSGARRNILAPGQGVAARVRGPVATGRQPACRCAGATPSVTVREGDVVEYSLPKDLQDRHQDGCSSAVGVVVDNSMVHPLCLREVSVPELFLDASEEPVEAQHILRVLPALYEERPLPTPGATPSEGAEQVWTLGEDVGGSCRLPVNPERDPLQEGILHGH